MRNFTIWKDFAAYSGPSFATKRHSHFFAQLCFANQHPLRLRGRNGVWREYQAAYIPSGVSHETEQSDYPFTLILMDPVTVASRIFQGHTIANGEPAVDVGDLLNSRAIRDLFAILNAPGIQSRNDILQILGTFEKPVSNARIDPRIASSLEYISNAEDQVSLKELASRAELSPGRFRHLFREQTGIAFSGYRLWVKTRKAITFLGQRPELIDAAYEGGFSDQAHFSRIFRRSFGMAPSELRKNSLFRVQIF